MVDGWAPASHSLSLLYFTCFLFLRSQDLVSLFPSHALDLSRLHSHFLACSLSLFLSLCRSFFRALSLSHSVCHSLSLALSFSRSLSLARSLFPCRVAYIFRRDSSLVLYLLLDFFSFSSYSTGRSN